MKRLRFLLLAVLLLSPSLAFAGSMTLLGAGRQRAAAVGAMASIYATAGTLPGAGTTPLYFTPGVGGDSITGQFNGSSSFRQGAFGQAGTITGLTASYQGTLASQIDIDVLLNGAAGPNFTCHLAATTNPTCSDVYSSTGHSVSVAAPSGTSGTNTAVLPYVTGELYFDTSGTWPSGAINISMVFQPTSGNAQSLLLSSSAGGFTGTTVNYMAFGVPGYFTTEPLQSYTFAEPGTLSFLNVSGSVAYSATNSNLISICHNTTAGSPGCIIAPTAGVTTCASVSGLMCVQTNAALAGSTNYPVWDNTDTLTVAVGDTVSVAIQCQTAACTTNEKFSIGALFTPSGSPIGQNISTASNQTSMIGATEYASPNGLSAFPITQNTAYALMPDLSAISATTATIQNVYVAFQNSPGAVAGTNYRQFYFYGGSTPFGTPAQLFQIGGASFHITNATQLPAGFCTTYSSTCAYGKQDTADTATLAPGYFFQYLSTCTSCSAVGNAKVAMVLTLQ